MCRSALIDIDTILIDHVDDFQNEMSKEYNGGGFGCQPPIPCEIII